MFKQFEAQYKACIYDLIKIFQVSVFTTFFFLNLVFNTGRNDRRA